MTDPIFCNCEFFELEEILSIPLLWLVLFAWWHFYSNMRLLWPLLEGLWPTWHTLAFCTMEESHLWKSISILLHSYLKIFCCLKMKSVENISGYIREQFYRFSRGCMPREKTLKCSKVIYIYTAIPYRVITGWKQGFPCEVFPQREKPVFITWTPCNESRFHYRDGFAVYKY